MIEINRESYINKEKVAEAIHTMLDVGISLVQQDKFTPVDHTKIKAMRTTGGFVNAGVAMIQQETALIRAEILVERMKQLGYGGVEQIEK